MLTFLSAVPHISHIFVHAFYFSFVCRYHPYIDNYDKASQVVSKLMKGNQSSAFLARLGRALPAFGGSFDPSVSAFLSLLIRPVQAVPRYRLLLERLCKAMPTPSSLPSALPLTGSADNDKGVLVPGDEATAGAAVETAALAEALRSAKECAERAEAGIQATAFKLNDSLKHKAAQVMNICCGCCFANCLGNVDKNPLSASHFHSNLHSFPLVDARGRGAKLFVASASTSSAWPRIVARRRLGSSVSRWRGRNLLFLPIYGLANHDHG